MLYSSKGLTYVVYARSNIDVSRDVKLRTINTLVSCSSDFGNVSAGSEGVVNSHAKVFNNVCGRQ